jgi:hypothetical protein
VSEGLSRRELIALAGAGVAAGSSPLVAAPGAALTVPAEKAGFDDNHGSDPQGGPTYPGPISYNPAFAAIAIIDFVHPWTIDVHHASFPLHPQPGDDPENYRLDLAVKAISWVTGSNERKLGHLKNNQLGSQDLIPHERKKSLYKGRHHVPSFEGFKFFSQNEIFIFLRNPDIIIDDRRLIRVTKYSADVPGPMDLNFSLFRARSVPGLGPLGNHGKLIRIENHVRDATGAASGNETKYSMNIHFKMRVKPEGAEKNYVPMVLDPDTGNGTGNEP